MKSNVHTGPGLTLKIHYPSNSQEKTIGFCTNLQYTVTNGQKPIFTVDSPFPAEIAQSASPSMVRGSMTLFLPKGSTPESSGLVPYRTDEQQRSNIAATKYLNLRIYDRLTKQLVMSLDYCKVSQYTVNIRSKSVVTVDMSFEGMFATPGNVS